MKILTIKYLLLSLMVTGFLSCVDEDETRVPELDDAVNVRIQYTADEFSLFNFDNLSDAKIQYDIFSQDPGNIEEINIFYEYVDNAAGETSERRLIRSYTGSDFVDGVIRNEDITAAELLQDLNMTVDDVNGGDEFVFYNFTTDMKNRTFPDTVLRYNDNEFINVTPNIINSAATTSFTSTFKALVGCPVNAPFTGKYRIEQIGGPSDPFFGKPWRFEPKEVTLVSTGPIFRGVEGVTYLTFGDRPFRFTLLCGKIIVPNVAAGLSCGGPGFMWANQDTASPFDPNDDTQFEIHILDNVLGACGLPAGEPLTLRFTKI